MVITAHQRQRVKPERRGTFCPCWETGIAKEPSWAVLGACTVVAWKHTCLGNWSQMFISYFCSTEMVFVAILYKTFPKTCRNFFLKCFSFPPIAQTSVPFSKLWEQKRNTSAPAEIGTREPSVERKRKYAVSKLFLIHWDNIMCD